MPSPGIKGEGQGSGEDPEGAAARNPPAYGARNVQIVAAGTGEALPSPAACVCCRSAATYNRVHREMGVGRKGVGGGRSTDRADRTTQPAVREGSLLRRCVLMQMEVPGECRGFG